MKIILHGCNGKMGQTIANLVTDDPVIEIVAGIDAIDEGRNPFPVYGNITDCKTDADVIIDFSVASALDDLLDYCVAKQTPCVQCTTGLSALQVKHIDVAAKKVAILRSANMSLGINLLLSILRDAAKTLAPAGFDIEIVEKHHNLKVDAPSGTALALGDAIKDELGNMHTYVYDRSQTREKRGTHEIGFSAVRGGTIVGEHDVIFAGTDEVVTFSHTAYSKAVFAKGAIAAAKFLAGKEPGLYTMADVIG
ncbi:MAG: 4-hydroxy-tetrahydrodipicolinate reductase [Lachnospiraceae bacterium]|jgi:4-hydroxy-tetrahydrodipicolinate reductase|nr:4-hydroxy-tetrahydrodipicolinate reductase [Lachnospiraceae bacterium]